MSDTPADLNLMFLPDWLKEEPSKNRYANFEGEPEGRGFRRDGAGRPGGPRRDDRGPRPGGGNRDNRGPGNDRRGPGGGPGGGKFGNKPGQGGQRRPGGPQGNQERDRAPRPQFEPVRQVVRVEILPEPIIAQSIAKQVRTSGRACGVFGLAKMFLEHVDRLRIRVTALEEGAVLYQIGDGMVAFDRTVLERGVFQRFRDDFYVTEIVQGEPPKGNYTSIARERFSGALLGPSSHHGYQVALRKLYEERFSRQMDFRDFQRNIEMVNDPAVVEQWKVQASSVTVIKTKPVEGAEPTVFKDEYDAEQHFKQNHLPGLFKSGPVLEMTGAATNWFPERDVAFNVRDAIDREHRFPGFMVNALRPIFNESGLHHFKWKKKILFVSAIRPQRHATDQAFSDGIAAILTTVGEHPGIKRPDLAARLLAGIAADSPEATAKKEALAADLHYLIHVGHVVEFQNGSLELPPDRRAAQQENSEDGRVDANAEMAALNEGAQKQAQQQRKGNQPQQQQQRQNQPKQQGQRRRAEAGYLLLIPAVLL